MKGYFLIFHLNLILRVGKFPILSHSSKRWVKSPISTSKKTTKLEICRKNSSTPYVWDLGLSKVLSFEQNPVRLALVNTSRMQIFKNLNFSFWRPLVTVPCMMSDVRSRKILTFPNCEINFDNFWGPEFFKNWFHVTFSNYHSVKFT